MKINEIYLMDCIEGMSQMIEDGQQVDLIVTSLPYNIGMNYDGYEDKKEWREFEELLIQSFDLMKQVIKDKGLVCVVVGNQRSSGLPHKIYSLLKERFYIIKEIFWFKGVYYIQGETIFVCSKTKDYNIYVKKLVKREETKCPICNQSIENNLNSYFCNNQFSTIWKMRYDTKNEGRKKFGHDAYFTKKIPSTFITINTKPGDLVLDPFMGVGTTAVAAEELSRKYIGFEVSKRYVEKSNERLRNINGCRKMQEKMVDLIISINNCKKCMWRIRQNVVPGIGKVDSKIMFIGEAPGYNEDIQGRPFVGKAGKIFDKLLDEIQLDRNQIYITNILKCRPPNNRSPTEEEIENCVPYLDEQIELIKPKIIVPLGNCAFSYIADKYGLIVGSMGKVHGSVLKSKGCIIIPVYHPATVLYDSKMEKKLKEDFKKILEVKNEFKGKS